MSPSTCVIIEYNETAHFPKVFSFRGMLRRKQLPFSLVRTPCRFVNAFIHNNMLVFIYSQQYATVFDISLYSTPIS